MALLVRMSGAGLPPSLAMNTMGMITPSYRLIRFVDPDGVTVFNGSQMPDLLDHLDRLRSDMPVESRGLARLRCLSGLCRDGVDLELWFIGD